MDSIRLEHVPRIAMFIGETSYLTPFVGSLYASLKSLGESFTYADLLGLSGAGNRLRWYPGTWDPSNVDLSQCEDPPFAPHFRALKAVGWDAEVRLTKSFKDANSNLVDQETAQKDIVNSIKLGKPVIAMGIIGPPECCVVFGYENSGESLVGWNYFQGDEGYDPEKPFTKSEWFGNLWGYFLLTNKIEMPDPRQSAIRSFRAIVNHFHQAEVFGAKVGLSAWSAMLDQLEKDDFSKCSLDFPEGSPGDDASWQNSVKGRFMVYCDALCQIYERHNVLPYYRNLSQSFPEWKAFLEPAIDAWEDCASYGGYLWKYMRMDNEGLEKFKTPELRKILATEGYRCREKDKEAIAWIEKLLSKEKS
jgi:hypothetical protein